MKITIHCIGKEKSSSTLELITEYLKRMPWRIEIKEYISHKALNANELKEYEGELLFSKVNANSFKILLDEKGMHLSSKIFSDLLSQKLDAGANHIEFFIGGANGHGEIIKQKCNYILSLSDMTFAHKLVRLILIEQLYRAYTIINNHPYHK